MQQTGPGLGAMLRRRGRQYMADAHYRAVVSLCTSLAVSMVFALYKLVTAVLYSSFWFGALAVYYMVLCSLRGFLLRHLRQGDYSRRQALWAYRSCGIFLLLLNVALGGVAYQMVFSGIGYIYPGSMIYAAAAYAFYCLTLAIVNMVKHPRLASPLLAAAKSVNLATALLSIFTLQTAMLSTFGAELNPALIRTMNAATGGTVCLAVLLIGIRMAVRGTRCLKTHQIK